MGTITKRMRRNGKPSYTAQIRIKKKGVLIYSQAETFSTQALAKAWMAQREAELEQPGALQRLQHRGVTVGQILKKYAREVEAGRTKGEHIKLLQSFPLAEQDAIELTSKTLIEHARERRKTAGPATILNDFIWLRVAFKYALHAWNMPVALDEVEKALTTARSAGLVAKPKKRARRVSDAEIEAVIACCPDSAIPMRDIIWFAVHSARRLSEITRIRWEDLDDNTTTGVVRNVKHPRRRDGNNRRCKFPIDAWRILKRQSNASPFVFPFNAKTLSTYFTRAVHLAGISDLHFHDLRHEGTSRLFERGHSIQEVQLITLHESWQDLKRYTHLRAEDVPDR